MPEKKRLNVMEMKCLRSMCGVTVGNRIRNEEIRRRVRQVDLLGRVEWYARDGLDMLSK